MYRAVTFIEMMMTLSITVIALYFISPVIFQVQDRVFVENEIENVKSFLYQIQDKVRYTRGNYALNITQNNQKWCIIAIEKKEEKQTACDCFHLTSCLLEKKHYVVYYGQHNVAIYNKKTYPQILTYFDGKSGNQSTICLSFSKSAQQGIVQIQRNGVINVIFDQKSRSRCKESA